MCLIADAIFGKEGMPLNSSTYLLFIMLILIAYMTMKRRKAAAVRNMLQNKSEKEKTQMVELAKKFIGKECIVYSFDSARQFVGVITEVTDRALLLENKTGSEAINLDYVIRIREYPKNKNGKKKSVVVD